MSSEKITELSNEDNVLLIENEFKLLIEQFTLEKLASYKSGQSKGFFIGAIITNIFYLLIILNEFVLKYWIGN